MAEQTAVNSILAVDFGSVHTRAVLIDTVEGVYRLVARAETRSTDIFPVNDMAVAFDRVLRQISSVTGRRFLTETGQIIKPERADRNGMDGFALTASIGRPLRAVVVGLVPDVSLASALRAAAGTYIEVTETLSLEDGRDEEERLNAILLSYPDVVFITGGTEHGAEETVLRMAETVSLALRLLEADKRPTIVYSGNLALTEKITQMFEEVTTLLIAENVRPSLEEEHLDSARLQLGRAFDRYKETRDASFALVGQMSDTGILPTAQSYTVIANYLEKAHIGDVALVDVGSSASTLAISQGEDVVNSIRTDLGLGHSAPQALEVIGLERLCRWIPFNITSAELQNYAHNKMLRPATVPMTLRELYIEHAYLRAGIRTMMIQTKPEWEFEPIHLTQVIGAGAALTNTGHPGYDALLLIDAVQPAGVTYLQSDPYGLVAAMGAIAIKVPEAVVQLLEGNNLKRLGTCISLEGAIKREKPALQARVVIDYGDEEEVVEETVLGGHLWVCPVPIGRTARVEIKCRGRASVNGQRKVKLTLAGGLVGLIFDARGRPLPLRMSVAERAQSFPLWIHEMTGDPLRPIDEAWLQAVKEEKPAEAAPDKKRREKKESKKRGKREKAPEPEEAPVSLEDELDVLLADTESLLDDDELSELRDVLS